MARKSRTTLEPAPVPVGENITNQMSPRALTKLEFGRRLHKLILERGWNQSDLARAANIGRDAVSAYVNGRSFPTPLMLDRVCKALDVERDELLPNHVMRAIEDDVPAVSMQVAAGHHGKAYLRINRLVSFSTAVKIVEMIDEDDHNNSLS